jgi:hypothetical protein
VTISLPLYNAARLIVDLSKKSFLLSSTLICVSFRSQLRWLYAPLSPIKSMSWQNRVPFSTSQVSYPLVPEMHACCIKISNAFILLDIHIDEYYLENSDPSALCHRKNGDKSKNTAGHFGALGSQCDSPVSLV